MSQPLSPSTEHLSILDVQEDIPQPRSAISDSARQERLAALERRLNSRRSTTDSLDTSQSGSMDIVQDPQPFDANHPKRIEFRRLVDPGIIRPNSKEVALRSLHVNLKSPFVSGRKVTMVSFFYVHVAAPPSCRHYLKSQRICFTSPTTPSSVSSSRRIRSSSEISWTPRARSSMRLRSVVSLFFFPTSGVTLIYCLMQMGFRPEV
jgi:hypothetical protein